MAAAGEAEDDGTCRGRRLARELCGPRTLVAKALVAQGRRFLGSGGRVRVEHAFERKWRAARVVVEIARAQSGSHACDSRRTRRRWCRTLRVARSELSSARSSFAPARDGRRAHRGVRAHGASVRAHRTFAGRIARFRPARSRARSIVPDNASFPRDGVGRARHPVTEVDEKQAFRDLMERAGVKHQVRLASGPRGRGLFVTGTVGWNRSDVLLSVPLDACIVAPFGRRRRRRRARRRRVRHRGRRRRHPRHPAPRVGDQKRRQDPETDRRPPRLPEGRRPRARDRAVAPLVPRRRRSRDEPVDGSDTASGFHPRAAGHCWPRPRAAPDEPLASAARATPAASTTRPTNRVPGLNAAARARERPGDRRTFVQNAPFPRVGVRARREGALVAACGGLRGSMRCDHSSRSSTWPTTTTRPRCGNGSRASATPAPAGLAPPRAIGVAPALNQGAREISSLVRPRRAGWSGSAQEGDRSCDPTATNAELMVARDAAPPAVSSCARVSQLPGGLLKPRRAGAAAAAARAARPGSPRRDDRDVGRGRAAARRVRGGTHVRWIRRAEPGDGRGAGRVGRRAAAGRPAAAAPASGGADALAPRRHHRERSAPAGAASAPNAPTGSQHSGAPPRRRRGARRPARGAGGEGRGARRGDRPRFRDRCDGRRRASPTTRPPATERASASSSGHARGSCDRRAAACGASTSLASI